MAERPTHARPLIAKPARFSENASALRYHAEVSSTRLIQAVYAAGGEPLAIHPDVPANIDDYELDDLVRERIWMADGVLLPGGGDLAAHWAGQDAHESQYQVDETQDAFDLAVARIAIADHLPLLAVCRGNQVVNVARGGDLVQDLTEALGANHRNLVHTIEIVDGSPLRQVVPGHQMQISCYHHQGISRLGKGLQPSAFASDGTVEAVTMDNHAGWYLGVQWHPEDTAQSDPQQAGIFRALVEASASRSVEC